MFYAVKLQDNDLFLNSEYDASQRRDLYTGFGRVPTVYPTAQMAKSLVEDYKALCKGCGKPASKIKIVILTVS